MSKQHSVTPHLNRRFLLSLFIISLTICLVEVLVMLLLDFYQRNVGVLTVFQEAVMDAGLMTLFSTPLLWFFVMRKLVVQIDCERELVLRQTRLNAELRGAVDFHALVSIADAKGRIIHANNKFCEVSGYSLAELVGKDHRIVNSGYHDKAYIRSMWETINRGDIWQGVFCNRRKNGSLYWVENTITPLRDDNGLIYQYISIRQDITVQKTANEQLILLRRAVDASTDMILLTDAYGCIQYVNPALCRTTQWGETELLGKSSDILDSPNCASTTVLLMQDALAKSESWSGRLLLRRKGMAPLSIAGQTTPPSKLDFWTELTISPVLNRDGSLAGYVQIQRDISEQVLNEIARQMEIDDTAARLAIAETLQQTQSLKEQCVSVLNILFGLAIFNLQRKGGVFLRAADEAVLEMFVLQGAFSEEFISKEKRIALGDCLCGRAAISGELLISDDCFCDPRHEHQFDDMKAHGHYIVPISVAGNILGIMFLYTDPYPAQNATRIAMLKQVGEMLGLAVLQERARESLENARDMAMQAALAKSEFLANMSHEIRTPMNGVLGMLDLLRDTDMSHNQWDLVETAYASAEALLSILNDILDFSKLEAGKVELEQIDFNLVVLVEDVCSLLAGRAHAKKLELNCFMPADIPKHWQGDPTRIRQVLTNLIGNAVKFTEQGEVSVTIKCSSDNAGLHDVRFEVRDTGVGIAPEAQGYLFQPFSQAESSTARRFGGTGLGLSISKTLVELMGGAIGLDSILGQGTCFWFSLPLTLNTAAKEYAPLVDIAGKRVLVVDDNATNRMILKHYLEHWGFCVGQVDSGREALDELNRAILGGEPYDLALLDMHMPEMDGLALAGIITKTPALAGIPRILLSSGGLIGDAERRALGLAQNLLKPARQSQLFDAISSALNASTQAISTKTKVETSVISYQGKTVLVAEDNKVNQKVIMGMLAKFQLLPEIADNGKLALDKLIENTYDITFMDCQMPVMDGYQATHELRRLEIARGTPHQTLIALTAHAIAGEREKCLAAGMDDYLTKPITQDRLAEILARWLNSQVSEAEQPTPPLESTAANAGSTWDKAAVLQCLAGDEELLKAIIAAFLEETPAQLVGLEKAYGQGELSALADVAHTLKGSLSYLSAESARACAARLEDAARSKKNEHYQQLTEILTTKVTELMASLRQFLSDHP
jgi:PAS domain S-box-containing protein